MLQNFTPSSSSITVPYMMLRVDAQGLNQLFMAVATSLVVFQEWQAWACV